MLKQHRNSQEEVFITNGPFRIITSDEMTPILNSKRVRINPSCYHPFGKERKK